MKKEDLSKLTHLDLLELRREINEEIDKYGNRDKTKCYRIFKAFDGGEYFVEKKNALERLKQMIEWDDLFEDEVMVQLDTVFFNEAEMEQNCKDYKKA